MDPMSHQAMGYDRAITMFSPDGRLLQVEYAKKTVKQGSTAIGMVCKDGVLLVTDKRIVNKLVVTEAVEKIAKEMDYPEIQPEKANSGDMVLIDVENVHPDAYGLTAAIMVCPEVAIAQGKDTLVYVEDPDIKKAWAI